MSASIPRDVQDFLASYPHTPSDPALSANLRFYTNAARCRPDNLLIEEIHDQWHGDYEKLERRHGFIQWLFPIREHGMNYESQPLQAHEIAAMRADPRVLARLLASYALMLDFYGMRLVDAETGAVDRALPPRNYKARYANLVRSPHNYLRISRILKCLSELGLERLNAPFVLHVLNEQSEARELDAGALRGSMDRWWANCIRDAGEREWVGAVIGRVRREGEGEGGWVFTRGMYDEALGRRARTGSFQAEEGEPGVGV